MRKNDSGVVGKGFLPFDRFKEFLNKNPFITHIEISNSGEPFLNPDLVKILEFADEKGIAITISNGTNFNTITEEVLEAIVKYKVRHITVSIDGASQEIYSQYRCNGNFEKVIANIKRLNEYKKLYHTEFPVLTWQFIVMEHNEWEAEKAKSMAEKLGMKIYFQFDWGGFIPRNPELLGDKDVNQYMRELCTQMIFSPQINWDGRLLGCCTVFEYDWNVNVFEVGLSDALKSEEYQKAVIGLLSGQRESVRNTPCGECKESVSKIVI